MANNDDEFGTFFRKHLVSVVQHLIRLGFTWGCAEEAAESAMATLYERWNEIDNPLPWVRCTARWRAIDSANAMRTGPVELTEEMQSELHHHDRDPIVVRESVALVQRPTRQFT